MFKKKPPPAAKLHCLYKNPNYNNKKKISDKIPGNNKGKRSITYY